MLFQHPNVLVRAVHVFPVLVVTVLLSVVYVGFAAQFSVPVVLGWAGNAWEEGGATTVPARLLMALCLAVFHAIIGLLVASYARTLCTDPGSVPLWWSEAHAARLAAYKAGLARAEERGHSANSGGDSGGDEGAQTPSAPPRYPYCRRCARYKPPRAHHCSVCCRCVLKMDHHCPWVANCVGFANHKYFLCFLFWIFVGCWYVVAVMGRTLVSLLAHSSSYDYRPTALEGSALLLCVAFGCSMLCFGAMHGFLVASGRTTLEMQTDEEWGRDRSAYQNACDVLGSKPWLWFIPVRPSEQGDGLGWAREFGGEEEEEADVEAGRAATGERLLLSSTV